ncbi:MAG: DUF6364 family protein [Cecembia sp.]
MKKRLNITIEEETIKRIKKYAKDNDISVSNLVEEHFEAILKPKSRIKNKIGLVDFVKSLPPSKIEFPKEMDWKTCHSGHAIQSK